MTCAPSPYRLSINERLRCHLICREPLIIMSYGAPLGAPMQLGPALAQRRATFLMGNWWSFLDEQVLVQTKQLYDLMVGMYPSHSYYFLTNSQQECEALKQRGLPSYFCHHNAFLDENLFCPLPDVQRTMDAVYTARLDRFKRHKLAKDIPSWGLIYYYVPGRQREQEYYFRAIQQAMPGMRPCNNDTETGRYRHLTAQEINRIYNTAKVGLCLSATEGGNYATTEYLLSGIPVVSTPSKGGREYFLDPDVSRIVPPTAAAVAEAVAELIQCNLSPRLIRLRALVRIREQRQAFFHLVNSIIAQEGRTIDFEDRFDKIFINKMITDYDSPEAFLRRNDLIGC